jgi:hypothetical protein
MDVVSIDATPQGPVPSGNGWPLGGSLASRCEVTLPVPEAVSSAHSVKVRRGACGCVQYGCGTLGAKSCSALTVVPNMRIDRCCKLCTRFT